MIDLVRESPGAHNFVSAIDNSGIKIRDNYYRGSLLLAPDSITTGWPPVSMSDLRVEHLEALFALRPEVALLGTGAEHQLLARELQLATYRRGVSLEVMSTPAACRTFNVLISDDRRVVAGLLSLVAT